VKLNRKEFIKVSGTAAVCACAGSSFNGCKMISGVSDTPEVKEEYYSKENNTVKLDLSKIPELNTVGNSVKLEIKGDKDPIKILVARTGDSEYKSFSNSCTHGQREIEYIHGESMLRCVSFGHSEFETSGKVISGPAEKTLTLYKNKLKDTVLIIELA